MPAAALPALTPYLATAGIGWLYYRRIRRSFGRQAWQPKRTVARLVLVSLVMLALVAAAVFLPHVGSGIALGTLVGAVLGVFALRHTHTQVVEGKRYYTPNPWIGGRTHRAAVRPGGVALVAGRVLQWRTDRQPGQSADHGHRRHLDRLRRHVQQRSADAHGQVEINRDNSSDKGVRVCLCDAGCARTVSSRRESALR